MMLIVVKKGCLNKNHVLNVHKCNVLTITELAYYYISQLTCDPIMLHT